MIWHTFDEFCIGLENPWKIWGSKCVFCDRLGKFPCSKFNATGVKSIAITTVRLLVFNLLMHVNRSADNITVWSLRKILSLFFFCHLNSVYQTIPTPEQRYNSDRVWDHPTSINPVQKQIYKIDECSNWTAFFSRFSETRLTIAYTHSFGICVSIDLLDIRVIRVTNLSTY